MTQTKIHRSMSLIVLVGLLLVSCGNLAPASRSSFESADCKFQLPTNISYKVECGNLSVPEDRSQSDSPLIQLHVAIVRSQSQNPAPDPIVYLAGGPGGYALDGLANLVPLFRGGLADRDLIVFDQRGVGYSLPSLNCPEVENQAYQDLTQNLSREERQQHAIQVAQACHDRLVSEGINLAAYTSAANAADVNDLRLALGYAKWNLYGGSYGTRLALTIMRDFPKGVRSVILDSVYPPQVDGEAEWAGDFQRALDLLFERCAADTACSSAYPDLETAFYDTVTQLDANPITLLLTRQKTQSSYEVVVNGDRLISYTFNLLYDTNVLPYLPKLIYELHEGHPALFQQFASAVAFGKDYSSEGMRTSVQCGEEIGFSSPQAVVTASSSVVPRLMEPYNYQADFTICASWGAKQAAAIENEPVVSNIPTLILAGDNDPITPPAWGKLVAETLSESHYFEFPWVGHGVLGAGMWGSCSKDIVSAFLADPLSVPDSTCLEALKVYFVTE